MNILIGGIGNIFFRRRCGSASRSLPGSQSVRFPYERASSATSASAASTSSTRCRSATVAVLVDTVSAAARRERLYVIEARRAGAEPSTPLALRTSSIRSRQCARASLGARARVFVVGCEPESFGTEHGQHGRWD
jgi:hypothetical protein